MANPHPGTDELIRIARKAAREAGAVVRNARNRPIAHITKSTPSDLVTEMDRASEELILEIITAARPGDGVVGEEGASKPSATGVAWWVDPIDGTTNYLRGLPNYSISIAATIDAEPIVGVVFDPTLDEMFSAIRGGGATLNGTAIAPATTQLTEAIIGTGFSYSAQARARQADVLRTLLPVVADVRRPGSAAVSLCWVACGRLDAFFERGLHAWDYAAGALIARESGADVQGAAIEQPSDQLVIASAPTITTGLSRMLA